MSNAILMLITLFVYIGPTLTNPILLMLGMPQVEFQATTYFISENIVTILLSYFIFRGLTWKSRWTKGFCVLILIASVVFLVNFVATDIEEDGQFNYVNEKGNG